MNPIPLNWPMILVAILPWGILMATALMTPRLSRPDLYFAVTVNPSFRGSLAGRDILRRYDRVVIAAGLLSLLPVALLQSRAPGLAAAGLLGSVALALAGWTCAFVRARSRTLPHHVEPSAAREAALHPRRVRLPGGWMVQAGPFAILAAAGLWLGLRWDRIPARIPIHWNAAGIPDGWSGKSPASVFGVAVIGLLTCSMLSVIMVSIFAGARRVHVSGPEAERGERFLRAMFLALLGLEYWMALLFAVLGLAALRTHPELPLPAFWPILAGQTLAVGSIFYVAFRHGQGGWRSNRSGGSESPGHEGSPVGDRTPDACWKLGMVYYNRADPALFVEKRFGLGWTLNMGNPRAILFLAGILLFTAASIAVSIMVVKGGSPAGRAH